MVQPALKTIHMPETPMPQSLSQRLEAEFAMGARTEPTVSSMAERFAPEAWRATRIEAGPTLAGDAGLPGRFPEPGLFSAPTRGVIAVLTAVAIAPAAILTGLLWFGALRGPDTFSSAPIPAPAKAIQQAAIAAAPALRVTPRAPEIALIAPEEILAKAGEEVSFAITIDAAEALPPRAVIAIRDLPEGATFSQGRPFGAREWSLRPDEIAGLGLQLPNNQTGAEDLRVELVAADGAVLARTATRLEIAALPAAGLVVRSGEEDRVEDLMAHGRKMIAVGYLAGARAYFERAAEAGSGQAALAVGATYDPDFIAALGVQGIKPDPEAAQTWYARATTLGLEDRETKLAGLKDEWARSSEPAAATAAATREPEEADAAPVDQQSAAREEPRPGPLGRLVAAATELASAEQWVEVSSPVNLREEASGTANTLKVMPKGAKFQVRGREGNWVQVANPATSEEGWIYTRFLKETAAP